MKRTRDELTALQSLPLDIKIKKTQARIQEWVDHYGEDGVFVSFSGGKDSTVLLHIVRKMFPNVKAVFCDTGLEYPEIREFVKTFDNVEWLKPKMPFKKVIEKYGYPFISKEVAECVYGAKKYLTTLLQKMDNSDRQTDRQTDRQPPYAFNFCKLNGLGKYGGGGITDLRNLIESQELKDLVEAECPAARGDGSDFRLARLLGMVEKDNKISAYINDKRDYSKYTCTKWKFMLNAPFDIGGGCCRVMKKTPVHTYANKTGKAPMTAQTASESRLRTQRWLLNGCNGFDLKQPVSNPMAFWLEQDILLYICLYGQEMVQFRKDRFEEEHQFEDWELEEIYRSGEWGAMCSVYGDIVTEDGKPFDVSGYEDYGIFELDRPLLKTTGCSRTGCVYCGFGCHLEKPGEGRFERLKETHPKLYDYIMRPTEEGGLNYKEIIDWLNENGNLHIKY